MFKLRKKTRDDDDNPFEGYVADGQAVADFSAEDNGMVADATVSAEPAPDAEPLSVMVEENSTVAVETPLEDPSVLEAAESLITDSEPTTEEQLQSYTEIDPASPTTEQVDIAIKEAEAETELPKEELLDDGPETIMVEAVTEPIPNDEIITDRVEEYVQQAPAPDERPMIRDVVTDPSLGLDSQPPASVERPVEQSAPAPEPEAESEPEPEQPKMTDEQIAAFWATHKELADLLGWAERDTVAHMQDVQFTINALNDKIDNMRASYAQDTALLSEDAKRAFQENVEKNIALLTDQIAKEQAKIDVLRAQKDTFISKLHEALQQYHDAKF